jgi:hypothetical protein
MRSHQHDTSLPECQTQDPRGRAKAGREPVCGLKGCLAHLWRGHPARDLTVGRSVIANAHAPISRRNELTGKVIVATLQQTVNRRLVFRVCIVSLNVSKKPYDAQSLTRWLRFEGSGERLRIARGVVHQLILKHPHGVRIPDAIRGHPKPNRQNSHWVFARELVQKAKVLLVLIIQLIKMTAIESEDESPVG